MRTYRKNGPVSAILSGLANSSTCKAHPSYVLSAALDAGASINALSVFVLSITLFRWWGLPHFFAGTDAEHCQVAS